VIALALEGEHGVGAGLDLAAHPPREVHARNGNSGLGTG